MTTNRWLYIVAGIAVGWGISTVADQLPPAFGHRGPSQAQYNNCLKANRARARRMRKMVPRTNYQKLRDAYANLRKRTRGMVSRAKYDNLKKLFQVTMKNVNKKMDTMRKYHHKAIYRKDQALRRARNKSREKNKEIRALKARNSRTVTHWKRRLNRCERAAGRR